MTRVVNPYSFVPFGSEKVERQPLSIPTGSDSLSGYLDVRLTAKSPLIIPDGAHCEAEQVLDRLNRPAEHRIYRFFTLPDGTNAIPGSTLRGLIRGVYEAVSNSCVPFARSGNPISMRTPVYGSYKDRGLLEYDADRKIWILYDTHVFRRAIQPYEIGRDGKYRDFSCAQQVYFRAENGDILDIKAKIPAGDASGWQSGWLQFHRPVAPDRPYHICILRKNRELHRWANDDEPYRLLRNALKETVDHSAIRDIHTQRALLEALDNAEKSGGCVPVWYLKLGDNPHSENYHLSPSSIGRVAQRNSWKDVMGAHVPCDGRAGYCPACLLFGSLGSGSDDGFRGHLSFTDARVSVETGLTLHTLPILASPREQAYEFYLQRPEQKATFWNYDYYGEKTRFGIRYFNVQPGPRGRKFYWHGEVLPDAGKSGMNASMEAMDAGAVFRFRIYFDRITQEQLNDLIWVITLGDNREDSPLRHKLGHAKPLGYGSVKLLVERCVLRKLRCEGGKLTYALRERPVEVRACSFGVRYPDAMKALLAICNVNSVRGCKVEYPKAKVRKTGEWEIYEWFSRNHTNPNRLQTLPLPQDTDISVHLFDEGDGKAPGRQPGRTSTGFAAGDPAAGLNWSELFSRYPRGSKLHGRFKSLHGKTATIRLSEINCDAGLTVRPGDNAYLTKLKSGAELEFVVENIDIFHKAISLKPGKR